MAIAAALARRWLLPLFSLPALVLLGWALLLLGDALYFGADSDTLYLNHLYSSLLQGTSLREWVFPPAPYLFPDLILYSAADLLARLFGMESGMQLYPLAVALLLGPLLYLWFGFASSAIAAPTQRFAAALMTLLLLALFALQSIVSGALYASGRAALLIWTPGFHFGTIVVLLIYALCRFDRRPALILFGFVALFFGLVSDRLSLWQGLAPLLLYGWFFERKRLLRLLPIDLVLLGVALALALWLEYSHQIFHATYKRELDHSLGSLFEYLSDLSLLSGWLVSAMPLWGVGLVVVLLSPLILNRTDLLQRLALPVGSILAALIAVWLLSLWEDMSAQRYLLPLLFFIPLLFVDVLLQLRSRWTAVMLWLSLWVVVVASFAMVRPAALEQIDRLERGQSELRRCLDEATDLVAEEGIYAQQQLYAYGDYWSARHLSWLSGGRWQIYPIWADATGYPHSTTICDWPEPVSVEYLFVHPSRGEWQSWREQSLFQCGAVVLVSSESVTALNPKALTIQRFPRYRNLLASRCN